MRILVAIGCDNYSSDQLQNLSGAENDGTAVFDSLVNKENSIYDKNHSILLKSPSYQDVREALQSSIFERGPNLELCLFFAGHGGVKDGAYFLCVSDTAVDRLSVSAISITELFMWINEAKVRVTSIVIDACQAGGIAYDVATFLKPKEIGYLGSPSISVLAGAAADQSAREMNGQGITTSALLRCLSGEVVVQTDRQSLSLIEVGHSVAELMNEENNQSPVNWGLNLFGRSKFCSNPCFNDPRTPVLGLPDGLISSVQDEPIIRQYTNKVWELYLSSSKEFDTISFLRLVQALLNELPSESTSIPIIVDALSNTFRQLVADSNDPFEEVELLGSCIASLSPYAGYHDMTVGVISDLANQLLDSIYSASQTVLNSIEENQFSLLSESSVLADLYYLPIRILKIFGWISAAQYIANILGKGSQEIIQTNHKLVRLILDVYTCSIVAVSDEQTCNLIVFIAMADDMGLSEEAEELFGLLCNTFLNHSGIVSTALLSGSDAYRFINARAKNEKKDIEELISSPSEFLSAILLASNILKLEDIVDDFIEDLDHFSANLFIPDSYTSFAEERIDNGVNYSFTIGHGVCCVDDFMETWSLVRDQLDKDSTIKLPMTKISAICSALIQPDRTPWFVCQ